jgi:hypothetical protein
MLFLSNKMNGKKVYIQNFWVSGLCVYTLLSQPFRTEKCTYSPSLCVCDFAYPIGLNIHIFPDKNLRLQSQSQPHYRYYIRIDQEYTPVILVAIIHLKYQPLIILSVPSVRYLCNHCGEAILNKLKIQGLL